MKTIKTLFVGVCVMVCMLMQANAQVVSIPSEGRVEQSYQLKSSEYDVDPAKLNMTFSYDIDIQEITLVLKLNRGSYEMLWLPTKSYDDQLLKRAVSQNLRGKLKMMRPFKSKITFGLAPTFDYYNCEMVSAASNDIAEELLGVRDSMVMRFRVVDPKRPVRLTMRSATPVQTIETPSGKMKYIFRYVADKLAVDMVVPEPIVDPCDRDETLALFDTVKQFYDTINKGFERVSNSIDQRKRKDCVRFKNQFEEEYAEQYRALQAEYESMPEKCEIIGEVLMSIGSTFEIVDGMQCPRPTRKVEKTDTIIKGDPPLPPIGDPLPPSSNSLAKVLKDYANRLNDCVNAIRSGRDVKKNKEKGRGIMASADAKISGMTDKEKENPQVKDAIYVYEKAKVGFQKNAARIK